MVNATKLCKDGGKQLHHWMGNQSTKDLLSTLQTLLEQEHWALENTHEELNTLGDAKRGIPRLAFKRILTTRQTEDDCLICGTYIHPDIVHHLGMWILTLLK